MIKINIAISLFVFAASFAIVCHANVEYKCNPAGNQQEMNACAEDDFKKADSELNKVYKALLHKEKDNKVFIKKLRESQNAWIKFRDAELAAAFACEGSALVCWGSMYPECYDTLSAKMTRERIVRLKKYLEEGQPADDCH
jgi:uncharacterized protein YecT (DUF1311 family)